MAGDAPGIGAATRERSAGRLMHDEIPNEVEITLVDRIVSIQLLDERLLARDL